MLRLASRWGLYFAFPAQAILFASMFSAFRMADTDGMTLNMHRGFTAFFASILALTFAIYLSSLSLAFKHPTMHRYHLVYGLIHAIGWYGIFQMSRFITLSILYNRLIFWEPSKNVKFGFLLILAFTIYAYLEISVIQWRISKNLILSKPNYEPQA